MSGERPAKLSLVVFSKEFDKVHYALVLASGAAAIDIPVTLFFTMEACRALGRDKAWRRMPSTWGPAEGAMLDESFRQKRIATFEELLAACAALGVKILVCEMGLKAIGMDRALLRDDIPIEVGGVVTFLNDASRDGAVTFV